MNILLKHCDVCGQPYETKREDQKYCSLSCSNVNRNKMVSVQRKILYDADPHKCPNCSTPIPYDAYIKGNRYCNQSCAARLRAREQYAITEEMQTILDQENCCLWCHTEISFKKISTNMRKYCSTSCHRQHRRQIKIEEEFNKGMITKRYTIRTILIELNGNKCTVCGVSEWNCKPVVMQVDHIDGDAGNNVPDNLRLICPNCHSQTSTYSGKNHGSGRKSKGVIR